MRKIVSIEILPQQINDEKLICSVLQARFGFSREEISGFRIIRKSVDARGKAIKFNLGVEVFLNESLPTELVCHVEYPFVGNETEVLIVGAGPAGLFAALKLIGLGFKPVVLERGKDVSRRKRDIAALHRNERVDPDSNYGFGEGGAGTFSDGKLYTRSKKRGDNSTVLEALYLHGAPKEILTDAHPHIGTNILPRVIGNIRKTILESGGEILFDHRVVDFIVEFDEVKGVVFSNGSKRTAKAVILATGHSAREIYYALHYKGIRLEAKNFAVGVRVEHPQNLIDTIQYKLPSRGEFLPPASYSFVEQVEKRGVYSFCMCPGGMIVPAVTAANEMVVNGMSPSERNGKFANSGFVVEIRKEDLSKYQRFHELAGLKFQEEIEQLAFKMANESMFAPAQRMVDFVSGKASSSLPATSYHPGLLSSDLHRWLPSFIGKRLQEGFVATNKKAKGFLSNDALLVGLESRTSSPIRIPRDEQTFEHVSVKGLFPCGEGAGYAGGIVSSAIDGERCAEKVVQKLNNKLF